MRRTPATPVKQATASKPATSSTPAKKHTTVDALTRYREKRDFSRTAEPPGEMGVSSAKSPLLRFVVQKHWARRLHYDFRLEIDGAMKSWAVPKGPSLDPSDKRMAVNVEDHPIAYNDFEGTIPEGQYGAGKVIIWDSGHWTPTGDPGASYQAGKLKFELSGSKLRGRWTLIRMGRSVHNRTEGKERPRGEGRPLGAPDGDGDSEAAWLLIKEKDAHARPRTEFDVTTALPHSVAASLSQQAGTAKRGPSPGAAERGPPRLSRKTPPPAKLAPQLATRVSAPPAGREWVYELKYDGYRILTRMADGQPRLFTRSGHDWTPRLPALAKALATAGLPDGWYDGEIVVLDEEGRPSFQALQNALETETVGSRATAGNGKRRPARSREKAPITYFLFDLPWLENDDLRKQPLTLRQSRLADIMEGVHDTALRLSSTFDAPARDMLASACRMGLEGIIGKRRSAGYVSGRSGHWIKLKCGERQEFVVGGYTDPKGSRNGLGSLLLGYYDDSGGLRYAGNVGSGFSEASLEALHKRLSALRQSRPPFAAPPKLANAHWVRPALAVEVSFSQWTDSGRIRHAVFQGLRDDKTTTAMKKEHSRRITSPERMVDDRSGTRKADIAVFYERIAPLMMPHLKDRPVSLLRAPDGIEGELFFQKHLETGRLRGLKQLDPSLDPGHDPLVVVSDARGLSELVQLNVIELHTWNALRTRIDRPDRISFDLDPGQGVKWPTMQEAAWLLHNFLQELGLPSFVKTSGGKGLHVIVPIVRRYEWDTVKGFSRDVVHHMAQVLPKRFSAKSGPRNRVGKIFIDYLRNGFGATTVAAWSLRARPGMGVSVPLDWSEVNSISGGDHWTIRNIDERLEIGNEPWAAYGESATALGPAMKRLGQA